MASAGARSISQLVGEIFKMAAGFGGARSALPAGGAAGLTPRYLGRGFQPN
jgi:hypothetical protein